MLSKGTIYGIRACLLVASMKRENFVPIREISEELNISFHFLSKILQSLTHAGILKSLRGPRGGVALALPASEIVLKDLVEAIEGIPRMAECILGLPGCGVAKPCPLHERWAAAQENTKHMFETTNLEELSERIASNDLRLV